MTNILTALSQMTGHYCGRGTNHEGQLFTSTLALKPLVGGRGISLQFTALGDDGEVYHHEESMIAPDANDLPTLWNFNSNSPGLLAHRLTSFTSTAAAVSLVFAYNDLADTSAFRQEVALDLWSNSEVTYAYSWGVPGGEFKPRSSVRMTRIAHQPRPECIKHYAQIQEGDNSCYQSSGSDELLSIGSPFAKKFGLKKLGIHHELLPSGRRTSWPHAESNEEEFVYVIEGTPDVWIDGHIYRLEPGDAVGFPVPTGIAHTFLNNTADPVRLLVVGEATKKDNRVVYPLHPERNQLMREKGLLWEDAPPRELGSHPGVPDHPRPAQRD